MPRTHLWCPVVPSDMPSQRWGHLAEPPACLQGLLSLLGFSIRCEVLLVGEHAQSSLQACRGQDACSRPCLLSQTVGVDGRSWVCGCQSSVRERQP